MHCCFHPQAMPPEGRTRYYPAVGPAIPRRWACSSRVTHPFATEVLLAPVRLACVRHAASVRPEPGSNSPMRIRYSSIGSNNWYCCQSSESRVFESLNPSPSRLSRPTDHRVRTSLSPDPSLVKERFPLNLTGASQYIPETPGGQPRRIAPNPCHLATSNPSDRSREGQNRYAPHPPASPNLPLIRLHPPSAPTQAPHHPPGLLGRPIPGRPHGRRHRRHRRPSARHRVRHRQRRHPRARPLSPPSSPAS